VEKKTTRLALDPRSEKREKACCYLAGIHGRAPGGGAGLMYQMIEERIRGFSTAFWASPGRERGSIRGGKEKKGLWPARCVAGLETE